MKNVSVVAGMIVLFAFLAGEQTVTGQRGYDDSEAYVVYATVLAKRFPENPNLKRLVFQTETGDFDNEENPRLCLKPDPGEETTLGPLIAAYKVANANRRTLQRKFDIRLPYEFVPKATIDQIIGRNFDGWPNFYEKYPGSNGAIHMSAVGFNSDKSLALVYMGYWCGGLCGSGAWHLMEKKQGRWVETPWRGEHCSWNS